MSYYYLNCNCIITFSNELIKHCLMGRYLKRIFAFGINVLFKFYVNKKSLTICFFWDKYDKLLAIIFVHAPKLNIWLPNYKRAKNNDKNKCNLFYFWKMFLFLSRSGRILFQYRFYPFFLRWHKNKTYFHLN